MRILSGTSQDVNLHAEGILRFLSSDLLSNQKSIGVFERILSQAVFTSSFQFWLELELADEVIAVSYKRDGDPVFVHASPGMSLEYRQMLLGKSLSFQGTESSLDLLFGVPGFAKFTVSRERLVMVCTRTDLPSSHHQSSEFLIRTGDSNDVDQLQTMLTEFASAVNMSIDQFSTIHDMMDRGRFFVACAPETGGIASMVYATFPSMSVSRISCVYTHQTHRRKGLSKLLVAAALDWTLQNGNACTLFVDQANHAALATYASVGFQIHTKHQVRNIVR